MADLPSPVALFDFDGTLTRGDSLLPFLRFCVGTPAFLRLMAPQVPSLLGLVCGLVPNEVVKQRVLGAFFGGRPLADLEALGRTFARERLPGLLRPYMRDVLQGHLNQGHRCYLVSASLDVYLRPWGLDQGFTGVLCSRLEVSAAGLATGRLQGRNVYGPEKVVRIQEALQEGASKIEYAYGDSRGDREMLALARQPWLRGRRLPTQERPPWDPSGLS